MANTHTTLNSLFTAIANAIRSKNGNTQTIVADNFPTEIENLKTNFDYINNMVTVISDYQFQNQTELASVNCNNLISIGASAFENCPNLSIIELPNTVTSIGENAINDCPYVVVFSKHASQPDTWNANWNPDNRPVIYGDPVETWDISATENDNVVAELYPNGDMYTLVIRGSGQMTDWSYSGAVPWGHGSSYNDNIISAIICENITNIGESCFENCENLISIFLPQSLITINSFAFHYCPNLEYIFIPKNINNINLEGVFAYCQKLIYEVDENNKIYKSIDNDLYSKDGTKLIAVSGTKTELNIPEGVTTLGDDYTYRSQNLIKITIPSTIQYWQSTGEAYNLTTVEISENNPYLKSINNAIYSKDGKIFYAFYPYSATNFEVPNGVEQLSDHAFAAHDNLTSITLPESIKIIGYEAFMGCSGLTDITIPSQVTEIEFYTFGGCYSLTNIILPDGLIIIGDSAFAWCEGLSSITISNKVTSIGYRAFADDTALTTINYNGTMAEWNAITKDDAWDDNTGNYTIYCTDGNIPKAS